MDSPSETETPNDVFKYVTVRDLQAFIRRVGQQRIYRPKEEGDEDLEEYAERYLRAVRRFQQVKRFDTNNDSNPNTNPDSNPNTEMETEE